MSGTQESLISGLFNQLYFSSATAPLKRDAQPEIGWASCENEPYRLRSLLFSSGHGNVTLLHHLLRDLKILDLLLAR